MDINLLVKLTAKAWSLKILKLMHDGVPGRQASLLSASGASRTAFAQSLAHLKDLGMLERNPGHGHPLRPEFRLTALGHEAAQLAQTVILPQLGPGEDLLRKRWTIPVLGTLRQPRYFNEIGNALPVITDRALSLSLKAMEGRSWVKREVDDTSRPPRSLYHAINTGNEIASALASRIVL